MKVKALYRISLAVLFCVMAGDFALAQSRKSSNGGMEIHIELETARETTKNLTGGKLEINGAQGRGLNKVVISCKQRQDVVLKDNPDGSFELLGTGVVFRNFDVFVIEDEETRAQKP